jgi:hypothetical protein
MTTKMRIALIPFFLAFILSGCNLLPDIRVSEGNTLKESIRGKWISTESVTDTLYGEYEQDNFLKFSKMTMIFCGNNPYDQWCATFIYKVIDENTISIQNIRSLKSFWTITENNDQLTVCYWEDDDQCTTFIRDNSKFNILLEVFNIYWGNG